MTAGKREPPLSLDMDFFEALERLARIDPIEVEESIERAKQKKPPEHAPGGKFRTPFRSRQPANARTVLQLKRLCGYPQQRQ